MVAEMVCPARMGQGCESCPCGTAKSSTALAPMEAITAVAPAPGSTQWEKPARTRIDKPPPSEAMSFSVALTSTSSTPNHFRNVVIGKFFERRQSWESSWAGPTAWAFDEVQFLHLDLTLSCIINCFGKDASRFLWGVETHGVFGADEVKIPLGFALQCTRRF